MFEILWNSEPPHVPSQDYEFYQLGLVDLGSAVKPRFVVRELHGRWSASAQRVRWNGREDETCHTPEDARHRFDCRKASIKDAGFTFATSVA